MSACWESICIAKNAKTGRISFMFGSFFFYFFFYFVIKGALLFMLLRLRLLLLPCASPS